MTAAAWAFYEKPSGATELGLFGSSEDDFSEEEEALDVWPCNWQAVRLFITSATQWRVGMSGVTGLDYGAVAAVVDCHGTRPRERRSMLRKVHAMEIEALTIRA